MKDPQKRNLVDTKEMEQNNIKIHCKFYDDAYREIPPEEVQSRIANMVQIAAHIVWNTREDKVFTKKG